MAPHTMGSGLATSGFFAVLMILLPALSDGVTGFTGEPPKIFFARSGDDVLFKWKYQVDDRNDLALFAFQWFTFEPAIFDIGNRKQLYVENKSGQRNLGSGIPASLTGRVGFEAPATLIIKNVSITDNNYYQFVIATKNEDIGSRVELFVTVPPRPYGEGLIPKCQTASKGHDAIFTCRVTGQPTPNVTWISVRQNKTLQDGEKYSISGENANSTLVIHNVDEQDNGEYTCVASNPVGEVAKLAARLTVPYISISEQLSRKTVFPRGSQTKELICATFGWPEPAIEWTNETAKETVKGNRFLSVRASDFGNYTCTASNIAGSKSLKATVVGGVPKPDISDPRKVTFSKYEGAAYYTVVGYLKGVESDKPIYMGIGSALEIAFDWCSFDRPLPGETTTVDFSVLADGSSDKVVKYFSKTFVKGKVKCAGE